MFHISVLLDLQANLPKTCTFFVCPNGFGEHLFSNVCSMYLGCITLITWCLLHIFSRSKFFAWIVITNTLEMLLHMGPLWENWWKNANNFSPKRGFGNAHSQPSNFTIMDSSVEKTRYVIASSDNCKQKKILWNCDSAYSWNYWSIRWISQIPNTNTKY